MADDKCARCGRLQSEHALVNHAEGPHIGASALVCPTALFSMTEGNFSHANAVAKEMKKPQ